MELTGRELDAEVARVVFGWTCIHQPRVLMLDEALANERERFKQEYGQEAPLTWVGDAVSQIEHSDYPPRKCALCGLTDENAELYRRLPAFSSDVADAFVVVEWLGGMYDFVRLTRTTTEADTWECECADEAGKPNMRWCVIETAATMPLAVCRAALRAAPQRPRAGGRADE